MGVLLGLTRHVFVLLQARHEYKCYGATGDGTVAVSLPTRS